MSDRTGKFLWEQKAPISLEAMKGTYDPALATDCRCGRECYGCQVSYCCEIRPWIALCNTECWDEEVLRPDGLPYGDMPDPKKTSTCLEEGLACDIFGTPLFSQDKNSEDKEEVEKEIGEVMHEALIMGKHPKIGLF